MIRANRRPFRVSVRPRSIVTGAIAAAALIALYLAILTVAQGIDHALWQLASDGLFVGLISAGLGIQVALFAELRAVDREHRAGAAVTAAATGTSGAAMLACCAHHLVELLPIVGLSAAAVFLNAYKTPLFLLGIGMNVVGVAVIARQLARTQQACAARSAAQNAGLRLSGGRRGGYVTPEAGAVPWFPSGSSYRALRTGSSWCPIVPTPRWATVAGLRVRDRCSGVRGTTMGTEISARDAPWGQQDARARALAIWPRLDRRKLARTCGDPSRVARLVARRTSRTPEAIVRKLAASAAES